MRPPDAVDHAEVLIDSELWPSLAKAIAGSREEILITQLLFEPGFAPQGKPLADMLASAAMRGVSVSVLLNRNAAVPDSFDELVEQFRGTPVDVRGLPMSPNVMHAKLVVVDGTEGFLVDPPFEQKYVDSAPHTYLGPSARDKPFHSVSLHVRGPVVSQMHMLASKILAAARAPRPGPVAVPRPAGRLHVALAHTTPEGILASHEELGILDAYERAIAAAKELIYVENQYFTSPRICSALASALAREPGLELVLLLNPHMDVPGYDARQSQCLDELGALMHPRIAVFQAGSASGVQGSHGVRPLYLHSKVTIIDDRWTTVGSANLDSISLHPADEFGIRAPPNVEVNAIIEDAAFAKALRRRLWGEHLRDEQVWRAEVPEGGWLAHWRRVAARNVSLVEKGDAPESGAIFPYGMTLESKPGPLSQ